MNRNIALFFLVLLFQLPIFSQTTITDVTVLDVKNHKEIKHQTVEMVNGVISSIRPYKRKDSIKGKHINGEGKYLIPGLTDAHVHFFQNGGLYSRPDAIDLRAFSSYTDEIEYYKSNFKSTAQRYLKNGITQVIDVGATYNLLYYRSQIKDSQNTATIWMTGPLLTTYLPDAYRDLADDEPFKLVENVNDGIKLVQEQLRYQPDFIKIWYIARRDSAGYENHARKNLPIVKAIIEEAHKNKLKVAVHATQRITAQLAVESGCDFLVHSIDDEVVDKNFIQLLKENKTVLCPTLIVHGGYIKTFGQQIELNEHDIRTSDAFQLGTLMDLKHLDNPRLVEAYRKSATSLEKQADLKKGDSIRQTNLKLLADGGITIATGTDAGNIGTLHSSSYLSEILAMKQSGLTNWQILEASTLSGAKVLGKDDKYGTVEVGKTANLVLLNENPLTSIENIANINVVLKEGNAIYPEQLLKSTPFDLAQQQLNAYNLRNIEAFLEPFSDSVEVYDFPDKMIYKGIDEMRRRYKPFFENTPNLHCELVERIVQGNIVIDKESVRGGSNIVEAVAIYHIENGKIQRVYFVR